MSTDFKDIEGWRRDETAYIVFKCLKCWQYIYVKATQKTKKCLRCGRSHRVKNINGGDNVKGMTAAVEYVKKKQNELALKEIGAEPDLRTINDYSVVRRTKSSKLFEGEASKTSETEDHDYLQEFNEIIIKLSSMYKKFPDYMIKMMAEERRIPGDNVKMLINQFKINGLLIPQRNKYYTLKKRKKTS